MLRSALINTRYRVFTARFSARMFSSPVGGSIHSAGGKDAFESKEKILEAKWIRERERKSLERLLQLQKDRQLEQVSKETTTAPLRVQDPHIPHGEGHGFVPLEMVLIARASVYVVNQAHSTCMSIDFSQQPLSGAKKASPKLTGRAPQNAKTPSKWIKMPHLRKTSSICITF